MYNILSFLLIILSVDVQMPDKSVLSVDDCIQIAVKNHPSIKASEYIVNSYRAKITESESSYFPQISLSSSYSRNKSGALIVDGVKLRSEGDAADNYSTGLSLRQNIYDFGKTPSFINVSKENLKVAEYNLLEEKLNVILNVKLAYYNYLKAEKLVELNKENVEKFKMHLDKANGFYRAGAKPKSDVTKAEVEFANARLNLIKAQNNLRIAKINLNNAMGVKNNRTYKPEDISVFEKIDMNIEDCINKALNNRPDILQIKLKENSAKEQIWIAKSDYLPSISGNASYNWKGQEFPLSSNWSFGISLNLPIFSGLSTNASVDSAESSLKNIEASKEGLELNIKFEVEQNFASLQETEEIYYISDKTVLQASENLDLFEGRYKSGLSSIIELTDAQVLLTNAKTDKIQALYDYKIAEAKLKKSMGEY